MMKSVRMNIEGKDHDFPLVEGTEGEKAIDITDLRSRTGYITLDVGYQNTGSCRSAITFIDGEKGILRYRGYSHRGAGGKIFLYGDRVSPDLRETPVRRRSASSFPRGSRKTPWSTRRCCGSSTGFPLSAHPDGHPLHHGQRAVGLLSRILSPMIST